MSKFDKHFRMKTSDVVEYVREKLPACFDPEERLQCCEIGDGNINYVFRVVGSSGKSVIVKHADEFVRSSGNAASTDRNRIEAQILKLQHSYSPSHVPEVFLYDPIMYCIVMEDVGDHENLRYALMAHKTFPTLARDIGEFMADVLVPTTDLLMGSAQKKKAVEEYINPDMCRISERLVFTEPFTNAQGSNKPFAPNEEFLNHELYQDEELKKQAAVLKMHFECCAQALIHGDLHSGSIFVKAGSTMVLDPEFAFYGPMGYDVGNVIAHLVFAWSAAWCAMEDGAEKKNFLRWLEETMAQTWNCFRIRAFELASESQDPVYRNAKYLNLYLDGVAADTAGYCGTEVIRRIIGSAKVKDITSLQPEDVRVRAERICILAAKRFMKQREAFTDATAYAAVLREEAEKV